MDAAADAYEAEYYDALKRDAQRYRWLRGDSCPDHSVRWTQWEVRCWRAPQWTADLRRSALDAAIDAATLPQRKDGTYCTVTHSLLGDWELVE